MGDFSAQTVKIKTQWKWQRANVGSNEKRKRLHLGRMGNIKKANSHEYRVPEERRDGVTKTEIECTLTNRPYTGSEHIMVMSNIKLDVDVESKQNNADREATKS